MRRASYGSTPRLNCEVRRSGTRGCGASTEEFHRRSSLRSKLALPVGCAIRGDLVHVSFYPRRISVAGESWFTRSAASCRAAGADGCRGSFVRAAAPAISQCSVAVVAVFMRSADRLVTSLKAARTPVAIGFLRQAVTGIAPCRRRGRHGGPLPVPPRRLRSNKSSSNRCDVQAVERIEPPRTVANVLDQIGSVERQPLCSSVFGA